MLYQQTWCQNHVLCRWCTQLTRRIQCTQHRYSVHPGALTQHRYHEPAQISPGGSSGYQSATATSVSPAKCSTDNLEDAEISDDPDFQRYEKAAMDAIVSRNGGTIIASNPRMRRAVRLQPHTGAAVEDDAYRRTREKNNAAAKQSRYRRKLREIHLSLKVTYLKRQLAALKAALGSQTCTRCHRSTVFS
ncbi:unnamed protein product [Spodoptera exigua]|uniref:BZIP domain-containing protein n=1 Tax=Spodoptera exigua TaxID=7107 RepID=A0A922MTD8_SPOEX|nr:hypothetical protein HF086_007358 [Spodoptera exigua]CAH0686509.1 unnamed protein product [Spodoptera exigua]